jgi:hypothetical protein
MCKLRFNNEITNITDKYSTNMFMGINVDIIFILNTFQIKSFIRGIKLYITCSNIISIIHTSIRILLETTLTLCNLNTYV